VILPSIISPLVTQSALCRLPPQCWHCNCADDIPLSRLGTLLTKSNFAALSILSAIKFCMTALCTHTLQWRYFRNGLPRTKSFPVFLWCPWPSSRFRHRSGFWDSSDFFNLGFEQVAVGWGLLAYLNLYWLWVKCISGVLPSLDNFLLLPSEQGGSALMMMFTSSFSFLSNWLRLSSGCWGRSSSWLWYSTLRALLSVNTSTWNPYSNIIFPKLSISNYLTFWYPVIQILPTFFSNYWGYGVPKPSNHPF